MRLHHVGIVVKDVAESVKFYEYMLGLELRQEAVEDEVQKVRVAFLGSTISEGSLIELVEPMSEGSPVSDFLKKGGGFHHVCYEVEDIEREVKAVGDRGCLIICEPVPATAFGGRRIAFVYLPNKTLIEFVECQGEMKANRCASEAGD